MAGTKKRSVWVLEMQGPVGWEPAYRAMFESKALAQGEMGKRRIQNGNTVRYRVTRYDAVR